MLARVFELQRRGVLHVHPVLAYSTPAERHAARLYVGHLQKWAPYYGFGFVERKLRPTSCRAAAAYLSSYFVTGKRGKLTLQESVRTPNMPRSIVHVSTKLTQETGVTMRELRFRRFVWWIARRLSCEADTARRLAGNMAAGLPLEHGFAPDEYTPSERVMSRLLGHGTP